MLKLGKALKWLRGALCLTAIAAVAVSASPAAAQTCVNGDVMYSWNNQVHCASGFVVPNGNVTDQPANINIAGTVTIGAGNNGIVITQPTSTTTTFSVVNPSNNTLTPALTFNQSQSVTVSTGTFNVIVPSGNSQIPASAEQPSLVFGIEGAYFAPNVAVGLTRDGNSTGGRLIIGSGGEFSQGPVTASAYNVTIPNSGGNTFSLVPPVCTGTNKALQFNGTAWLCVTI